MLRTEKIAIQLPPLDEQNLIIKKIDFAILNFKKSKELIEIYKQSIFPMPLTENSQTQI